MKNIIQISVVVVLVLVLLQAMAGGTFSAAGSALANGSHSYAVAPTSVQSVLVISCWDGRVVSCVTPNVGWNS